jgi:hypothetical protein
LLACIPTWGVRCLRFKASIHFQKFGIIVFFLPTHLEEGNSTLKSSVLKTRTRNRHAVFPNVPVNFQGKYLNYSFRFFWCTLEDFQPTKDFVM